MVDCERFRLALTRTPSMVGRLFTDGERGDVAGQRDPSRSLAARFAAKEAAMKALGVGLGAFPFRDVEVVRPSRSAPELRVHGRAAELAARRGVRAWKVSLTHSTLVAEAIVVAL